jgi:cation transport ATPase
MKTERMTLPLYRLGCAGSDPARLEHAMGQLKGVHRAYVNPATEMAYIDYDPDLVLPTTLQAVIDQEGLGAEDPVTPVDRTEAKGAAEPRQAWRLPPDTVGLVLVIWLCTLPLIALLIVPLLGVAVGMGISLGVLVAGLVVCWLHDLQYRVP